MKLFSRDVNNRLEVLGHNWRWWHETVRGRLYGYCDGCDYELGCGMKCGFCGETATTYRYHTLTCRKCKKLVKKREIDPATEKLMEAIFGVRQ